MLSLHSIWWQGHFPFELGVYLIKENLTLTTPISSWAESHAPLSKSVMKRMWSQCSTWVVRLRFVQTEREGQAFLKKERMTDPTRLSL